MSYIKNYPTPISGLTLGMCGIAAYWYAITAGNTFGYTIIITVGILSLALLVPLLLKFVRYPTELYNALRHPTIGSVVPTFAMTIMLLSHTLKLINMTSAWSIWLFAVIIHILFLFAFTYQRCRHADLNHMVPSWFVPPIGIVVACITIPSYHFMLLAKILLGFGLIAYIIMLPLMLYRMCLGGYIEDARKPTLAVFAAPASLTLTGYLSLIAHPNPFLVIMLFTLSFIMAISVYLMLIHMLRLPFSPAYSSFTFPLAISATATYKMSLWTRHMALFHSYSDGLLVFAIVEGAIASIIIIYVLYLYLFHHFPKRGV